MNKELNKPICTEAQLKKTISLMTQQTKMSAFLCAKKQMHPFERKMFQEIFSNISKQGIVNTKNFCKV